MQQIQATATIDREAIDGMLELENALEPPQEEESEESREPEAKKDERVATIESRIELKIDEPKILRSLLKAITSLKEDEAIIKIAKEGVAIIKPDHTGIAMVRAFVPNREWTKFEVESEVELGVNVESLEKLLGQVFKKKNTSLAIEEFNTKIKFVGIEGTTTKKLSVPTIEIKNDHDKEPICEYKATFEINADVFNRALKDTSLISTYTTISAKNGDRAINLSARGDCGEHDEEYLIEGKMFVSGDMQSATYNTSFLLSFLKGISKKDTITISFSTDGVLKLNRISEGINLTYYLANYAES